MKIPAAKIYFPEEDRKEFKVARTLSEGVNPDIVN